ncbi:uncharacterized protein LOC114329894 [Diabrotica virgifera virgifera]|uniref:Uncharacterized protein n=1 Tax=Diabrotica virgifera virgifera TaxID=50390 RepID=A0ABM5KCC9_DIAVI|nr:uncharacterized protein LOC114329894 [Diabrotica virgifera virgifera]
MEMDIDLDDIDFGDKVKDFLAHKLNEIKIKNASIEKKINERKTHITQMLELDNTLKTKNDVITFRWKKCFNSTYVICYSIHQDFAKVFQSSKPILKWTSSKQLIYKIRYYPNQTTCQENRNCNRLIFDKCSESYLVVMLDTPNFLESLECTITGKLLTYDENKGVLVDFPNVKLLAEDLSNRDTSCITLLENQIEDLITMLSVNKKTDVVIIFPEGWNISMDDTFEIHCALTKLTLSCSCKKFFLVNRISNIFDNSILELDVSDTKSNALVHASIYCSSQIAFLPFLHHIHQHTVFFKSGVKIIPRQLYEQYRIKYCTDQSESDLVQKFQNAVNDELGSIESFSQSSNNSNLFTNRTSLSYLEKETDLLYLKLCERINIKN